MSGNSAILKKLREDLVYWEGQARMEERWLNATREKCKEIEQRIREFMPREGSAVDQAAVSESVQLPLM